MRHATSCTVLLAALAACDGPNAVGPAGAPDARAATRARRDPRPRTPPDSVPGGLVPLPFPLDTVVELS